MHRKEINERSPLRVLEQSTHGGLGRGNLGVVIARRGVGKTAFLVGVALDDLMRGRKVLHVSVSKSVEKVRDFYDDVFQDLAHTDHLEDVWKVRLELERNRRIHCYREGTFSAEKLSETLRFMSEHGDFAPVSIMIDGLDFENVTADDLASLRKLAVASDVELWMSAVTRRDLNRNERGVPEPVAALEDSIDVILSMGFDETSVQVELHKDHDNPNVSDLKLALDPKTLLIRKE
jgi:hypothetical protein